MAHRSKTPAESKLSPIEQVIIGAIILGIGIVAGIGVLGVVRKALVKSLPWNVW